MQAYQAYRAGNAVGVTQPQAYGGGVVYSGATRMPGVTTYPATTGVTSAVSYNMAPSYPLAAPGGATANFVPTYSYASTSTPGTAPPLMPAQTPYTGFQQPFQFYARDPTPAEPGAASNVALPKPTNSIAANSGFEGSVAALSPTDTVPHLESLQIPTTSMSMAQSVSSVPQGSLPPTAQNLVSDMQSGVVPSSMASVPTAQSLTSPVVENMMSPTSMQSVPTAHSLANAPTATVAVDTTGDGRANMMVTGVDANRDGIPDVLQPPTAVGPGALQPGFVCSIQGLDCPPGCPEINRKVCTLLEFQREKWLVEMQDGSGKARVPARALVPIPSKPS